MHDSVCLLKVIVYRHVNIMYTFILFSLQHVMCITHFHKYGPAGSCPWTCWFM